MKKAFDMPKIVVEQFVPNEYVAACGDKNKVYKFKCDAGGGAPGSVYKESNGQDGYQLGDELMTWGGYHACGEEHEAPTGNDFFKGYYRASLTDEYIPVMIWCGPDGNNIHCTTKLNMSEWETAKS